MGLVLVYYRMPGFTIGKKKLCFEGTEQLWNRTDWGDNLKRGGFWRVLGVGRCAVSGVQKERFAAVVWGMLQTVLR